LPGALQLSWPGNNTNWLLQYQSNSLSMGLGTNWVYVPGLLTNPFLMPVYPGAGSVFFRLVLTNPWMPQEITGCYYLNTKKNGKICILDADDHYIVRMGLVGLIGIEPDMEVVAEAADGNEALELFAKHLPDLLLLDLRMPDKDGIYAVEIREQFPEARILVLSAFDGDEDIYRALHAGAQGYIRKNTTGDMLVPALRTVASGKNWIPKDVAVRLASRKIHEQLTTREVDVLNELAKGLANKEIADTLKTSEHTVKGYLKNILRKLHVTDRTEAATTGIQRGIIQLQSRSWPFPLEREM
jgi:DNA-binding NarL/FixJ family response regulator